MEENKKVIQTLTDEELMDLVGGANASNNVPNAQEAIKYIGVGAVVGAVVGGIICADTTMSFLDSFRTTIPSNFPGFLNKK